MGKPKAKRLTREERRTIILAAAADVFFDQGYGGASIDAIIEKIGGSKREIYTVFGSKEGLFIALVSECAEKALDGLDVAETDDLHAALMAFGRCLLEIYMTPTLLGVYRTILTEAMHFPILAEQFFTKGPERASIRLTEILEHARLRGETRFENSAAAADHFVGMFRANRHLQVVLGLRPPPDSDETEMIVAEAVSIFLDGIRSHPERDAVFLAHHV